MNTQIRQPSRRLPSVTAVRAFSLIEVLIAVLIMAIGLLGLGAVIPVVVREQRLAADATAGVAVGRLAKDVITERLTNKPAQAGLDAPIRDRVSPLDAWLDDLQWSERYEWEPWDDRALTNRSVVIHPEPPETPSAGALREGLRYEYSFDSDTGDFRWLHRVTRSRHNGSGFNIADGSAFLEQVLTVRDRLWPSAAVLGTGSRSHRPQFVWDFIARRVDVGVDPVRQRIGRPAEMEIAVFVRRIDLNIRLPRDRTLFEVLTDRTIPEADRRLPVAIDRNGVPTGNGTNGSGGGRPTEDAYSAPLTLRALFELHFSADRKTLYLVGSGAQGANALRLAAQPGQRLVDNLGHVYTVREVTSVSTTRAEVVIDPPVPPWVPYGEELNRPTIRQVTFTPQIPAAVSVFRIARPVVQP
jgi:prepilin-type N-terminal cleavage/methylation domain-containing protein